MKPAPAYPKAPRHAFTLTELLVVLGIIGALTAIILPGVSTMREQSRLLQCTSNIRQVAQAVLASSVSKGRMPVTHTAPAPPIYWFDKSEAGPFLVSDSVPSSKPSGGILVCPSDEGIRSYSMNVWASSSVDGTILSSGFGKVWNRSTPRSERMILIIESWSYFGSAGTGWLAAPIVGARAKSAGRQFGGSGGVPPFWAGRFDTVNCEIDYTRHRSRSLSGQGTRAVGSVNIAYADAHVELKSNTSLVAENGTSTKDTLWSPAETP